MGKVGNLTRLVDVVEPDVAVRGRGERSLRMVLVGLLALAIGLFAAAISGAAPPTEASVDVFDQCANGAPPSTATDCPQNWINGILNTNNSHYAEDDVTPQRVVLDLPKNGPLTGRTVEISFLTRKGGVHAYDSLATWNHTQTSANRCANLHPSNCVPDPPSTFPIPSDPTVVADNNGPGSATSGHQLGGQVFTMYGGTITAASAYTHDDASGTSDSYAHITLTYSVPDLTTDRNVMLLFGGHIAASLGPRGWGAGVGAGSISGGPYHMRITAADGASVGNRDNQIMSGAILAPANLVINKVALGGDATFGYTGSNAFSITTSGGSGSQSFTDIAPGSYTVTESAPPAGWDFTSLQCVDEDGNSTVSGMTANVVLAAGETATCTYTNTKRGQILVDKVTAPSGDPESFPFTLTGGPEAINQSFNLTDAATPHDSGLVRPGSYAASETSVPAGWDLTSSTCSDGSSPGSIGLDAGETVTCTFTNTKRGALVVYKQVVNDNGGSAVASAWTMNVAGPTNLSFAGSTAGTSNPVLPGSYTVGESGGPPGYGLSYPTTGLPAGATQDCNAQGAVSVGPGETKRCVLRNDDQPGSLTVIKHVINDNGGTKVAGDFAITVTGSSPNPASFNGSESGTNVALGSGSYGVSEVEDPGYAASYSTDCTGSIALGESKTCTITNDDKPASLTVIKHVINDNGGTKTAAEFAITVTGNSPSPASFPGAESPGTSVAIGPGSYDVTEVVDPDYAASYSADCTGSIALGDSRTCTITNDDKPATLTVIKNVINDNGGTKVAADFAITATGNNPNPTSFPGEESPGTSVGIGPGSYGVSEVEDPGYTASYSADCTGSIALGDSKTCTITNDDKAPKLTLVKEVVNDNGGLAQPSAWTLTADGPTGFSGPGPSVVSGTGFDQGSYDLSESGPPGYDASDWSCTGQSQVDADTVDVGLGDDITCTITNNDQPATLTVIKHVVNDNGGTLVAGDFPMQVTGSNPNPASFAGAEDPGTSVAIGPGSYNVTETEDPDYAASYSADCTGSIALGESKTCTITNDDNAPKLTLVKVVVNDDGGLAVPIAWTLTASGPTGFAGLGPSVSSDSSFDQGSYDLSESGPAGYDASDWSCTGESQVDADTVDVDLGDDITCTITNNDEPATLIVKKVVVNDNGGTKQAQDFSFQLNGGAAQAFEPDGQNDLTVNAGTYNVTEPAVAGYTTTYGNCTNLVIPNGGSATCTITNNDVPPGQGSLTVSKSANPVTIKEPGGPVTFSVTITNTSVDVVVTIDNVVDDKFGDLDDSGGNGCFDVPINLAPGQKVNCTFERNITGVGGSAHVNTVTVTGHDPAGHTLTASDDARVDITPRLIDLVIVKDASSPTPLNGIVNYTLTVTNKGPEPATNVQLADPAPAGITYLSANPSQGTCNLSASLITCSLGTIAPGQTVTIAVTGRATAVGTHTNTATVTGAGGRETNPADNVDSAITIVPAPLKPPTAKPTPPAPEICLALTVSPKMLKADGTPDRVTVKVTAGTKRMKGVKVVLSGAGVKKSGTSNGRGVALLRINPRKAGILTITALERNQQVCGPKRIGVVGVFLPPLTG